MSDTPEYILRKPIKAKTKPHSSEYVITELFFDLEHDAMHPRIFDEWFVLLDRQALQIAIREEIREYAESMLPDYGVPIHKTERLEFLQGEQTDVK